MLPSPLTQLLGSPQVLLIKVRVVYEMVNLHLSHGPVAFAKCQNLADFSQASPEAECEHFLERT